MIVLKLKTPFDPGMYDEGNTYAHVLVTNFNMSVLSSVIQISWEYGTFDLQAGWQGGKAGLPQTTIVQNDDFYKAIGAMPDSGSSDSILMAAARECYDLLILSGAAPGDVVDIAAKPPAPNATPISGTSTATPSSGGSSAASSGANS